MANNLWSNYTEKTATPVDTDEVMVRDSTDGKNKRLLFGTFWKWVAKKLNEATISELETDNKTIIGAINALYGKGLATVYDKVNFTSTTEFFYTGLSVTIPKNTFAILTFGAGYASSKPSGVIISKSDNSYALSSIVAQTNIYPTYLNYIHFPTNTETTYYVWAKYDSAAQNFAMVSGGLFKIK